MVISPLIVLAIFVAYFVSKVTEELTYTVWDPDYVSILSKFNSCLYISYQWAYTILSGSTIEHHQLEVIWQILASFFFTVSVYLL